MNDAVKVEDGANVLNTMVDSVKFDDFRNLFLDWYGRGSELNLGMPYLKFFVDAVAAEITAIRQSSDKRTSLLDLSRRLFENGNKPLVITVSTTLKDFCDQYTGVNLRWETVGVILTFIGTAAIEIVVPHSVATSEQDRQRLRLQMIHAGDACISFCESFDSLNDVQIVLLFVNYLLRSLFDGDQSYRTWRRLNDVTGALFAFGLHEPIEDANGLPFFLVQLRKRLFARVYSADISLATFLGRPPRGQDLADALSELDENGWNTRGQIRKSAVTRWSMIASLTREELLELLLGRDMANVPERIAKIRVDAQEAWESLPAFLRCSREELWSSDRLPRDLDTLHVLRILYLHNLFLIERAVTKYCRERTDASVAIASEMLTWVNDATVRRERLSRLGLTGLSWWVMAYGLPAAGVLALELLQQSRKKWASHIELVPRTRIIQDLSVLIVHMDVLVGPGDGNYQVGS
ncbi:putative c6 transcription factor [Phaeomoniella chlamydospora]|uniref:Putative c6 transcription factor n=1 Tax=Phaeomoniella chlamydospora TaxID=158046 RepID=A0A0G2H342_PHACM|nr:putative c6 transcription factor [Phaeomoniella chlamydospora]